MSNHHFYVQQLSRITIGFLFYPNDIEPLTELSCYQFPMRQTIHLVLITRKGIYRSVAN